MTTINTPTNTLTINTILPNTLTEIMTSLNDITNMLYNNEYVQNLTHQTKFNSLIQNSMYDNKYIFTLQEFKDILLAEIITIPEFANETCKNMENAVNNYLIDLFQKEWIPIINKTCKYIGELPQVEQRTPEWFELRRGVITASEAGYLLGKKGPAKCIETIKIKSGVMKAKQLAGSPAIDHGVTYEDVVKRIYELRYGVSVTEYGIIKSSDSEFIGASPDGIVTHSIDMNNYNGLSRVGRMIEIKCPYSRVIDNTIVPEYAIQILQQQYTCKLPICDFIEATIYDSACKPLFGKLPAYKSLDDLLNDTFDNANNNYIQNKNIPLCNLTINGTEKGIIATFKKIIAFDDIRNTTIIYPIEKKYNKEEILNWQNDITAEMELQGWTLNTYKYWRIEVFDVKTVVYNETLYQEEYIPRLKNIWDIIIKSRDMINNSNNDITNVDKYISGLSKMELMLDGDCEKYEYGGRLNKRTNNITYNMSPINDNKNITDKPRKNTKTTSIITHEINISTIKRTVNTTNNTNNTNSIGENTLQTIQKISKHGESIDDFLNNF